MNTKLLVSKQSSHLHNSLNKFDYDKLLSSDHSKKLALTPKENILGWKFDEYTKLNQLSCREGAEDNIKIDLLSPELILNLREIDAFRYPDDLVFLYHSLLQSIQEQHSR